MSDKKVFTFIVGCLVLYDIEIVTAVTNIQSQRGLVTNVTSISAILQYRIYNFYITKINVKSAQRKKINFKNRFLR